MSSKETPKALRLDLITQTRCVVRHLLRACLVISLFALFFAGLTSAQESQNNTAIPGPVPLGEIANRSIEASNSLRDLQTQFASNQVFKNFLNDISDVTSNMAKEEQEVLKTLQSQPSLDRLQAEEAVWQNNKTEMNEWLGAISRHLNKLQSALSQLEDLQKSWSQTLDIAKGAQAQDTSIQQISDVILSIEMQQKNFQNEHATAIDLQRKVNDRIIQCETILDKISQSQRTVFTGIGGVERLPIWSKKLWDRAGSGIFARMRESAVYPKADIESYFFSSNDLIWIHFGIFIFLSALFFSIQMKIKRWASDEGSSLIFRVFDHPFAAALIITLFAVASPFFSTPPTVKNLFHVLAVLVLIRSMRSTVNQRMVFVSYALILLLTLDTFRHAFSGAFFFNQVLIVTEALAGLGVLGWSLIHENLKPSFIQATVLSRFNVFRAGVSTVMAIFAAGLVAGILGFNPAADVFVSSVIMGGCLALGLFAALKILGAVVAFYLRMWPLKLLNMVRTHRFLLERRIYRILAWTAVLTWLIRVLYYVGLLQPVLMLCKSVLALKLERGTISISLEDIFAFFLTLWVAFLLSTFICFVLNEDIYPRTKVPRGISYSITRLLHYLIMVVGFLVGLGVLGIDLTRITVLISAFGVGIGFGLQSVVNNFVSGLILLFERPIQMDDSIEVGNIQGSVKRIGLRSSILRTRQGAEIIIPNSQLVSEQVTNWTYSDQFRRIDLPVGVNYSAAPREVIEVLTTVAANHNRILKNPPPQVLLIGYGDSSINYELRAWTDEFVDWPLVRSELAIAVYDAIHAAGMSFPFPQREVRLINVTES